MRKTEFLRIPVPPEDRERLQREADRQHLDLSTWARRALLKAAEDADVRYSTTRVPDADR
jgi:hypothetical protein